MGTGASKGLNLVWICRSVSTKGKKDIARKFGNFTFKSIT